MTTAIWKKTPMSDWVRTAPSGVEIAHVCTDTMSRRGAVPWTLQVPGHGRDGQPLIVYGGTAQEAMAYADKILLRYGWPL